MQRFKVSLLAAAGILILAFVLTAVGPKRVMAALGYTPVRDVDQPARQPFGVTLTVPMSNGDPLNSREFTVPDGKRLVIDTISVTASLPSGQRAVCSGDVYTNNVPVVVRIPTTYSATLNGRDIYVGTVSVQLFADESSFPSFGADRTSTTGSASVEYGISGHLVNLP